MPLKGEQDEGGPVAGVPKPDACPKSIRPARLKRVLDSTREKASRMLST